MLGLLSRLLRVFSTRLRAYDPIDMAPAHHVLLIPGFFAFEEFGELRYFWGVRQAIERAFERRGEPVSVHEVTTLPTASIRDRAAKVLDAATDVATREEGPLHLVGHSTGGLDARLAIAPTARLPTDNASAHIIERVGSIVTVSTPHGGSPLASFFASVSGKPLLRLLTAMGAVLLEKGELPTTVILKLGELVTNLDDLLGLRGTVLDELYDRLLSDLSTERRERIVKLLREISDDTALVFQLTPEGVDLLDAATGDPDQTKYGCVVTRAPSPSLKTMASQGRNVYGHAMHVIYAMLSTITARARSSPTLSEEQAEQLRSTFGDLPGPKDHDGLVPTLSQPWGTVITGANADHLDVVGHFGDPEDNSTDWLPSGSGFDREGFDRVWDEIAGFQLGR